MRARSAEPRGPRLQLGSVVGGMGVGAVAVSVAGAQAGPAAAAALVAGLALPFLVPGRLTARPPRRSRQVRPVSIALAGNGGVGKDTLCDSLRELFGESRTTVLNGDDYHRYDRPSGSWKVRTHLHPSNNDLRRSKFDALALVSGRSVDVQHYDHSVGRFGGRGRTVPGDVVVLNGLHSLVSRDVRSSVDLCVYLEMDEGLRRRLKIRRDVEDRGYSPEAAHASFERRVQDGIRYVSPQRDHADVVLRLEPVSPGAELAPRVPMRLQATLRDMTFADDLVRTLASLVDCHGRLRRLQDPGVVQVELEPDALTRRDVASAAQKLGLLDLPLVGPAPRWAAGTRGVAQIIVLLAVTERRLAMVGEDDDV